MRGRRQERIEAAVDHLAAAALGGAVAFACAAGLGGGVAVPRLVAVAAIAAALVYLASARLLRRVEAVPLHFDVPVFRASDLEQFEELLLTEQTELVLTEADRLSPVRPASAGELMLDDILAELGPDSRVVRLFDPAAMPTPAQLNARIERHLGGGSGSAPAPDASHALYEALNELRRSLR